MAYAALNSLRSTLTRVRKLRDYEERQFKFLNISLKRLDDDRYRGIDMSEINEVDAKLREAAWKLEDVIDSYLISQEGLYLECVEHEIRLFFIKAMDLRITEYDRVLRQHVAVAVAVAVAVIEEDDDTIPDPDATTVGYSDLFQQIITRLLNKDKGTEILALWGMAGIGKTHLVRDIYHHPPIVEHFDLRLWVTVGQIQESQIKDIFVDILARIEPDQHRDTYKEKDQNELRDLIRNTLRTRTCLIVLDDVWSQRLVWGCEDALARHQNDQRILVTTRLGDVAEEYLLKSRNRKAWQMPFLSDEESWELLSQRVFAEESFPTHQLEKPGRKIAHLCEGLPLLILTVADILRGLDQTREFWNKVADKKTTTFPDAMDRIYEVLMLSYNHLHLKHKAPFLYMGVFPQSHEIPVSKLNNLWEIEDYYKILSMHVFVTSSLAIACKRRSFITSSYNYSELRSCKLHCTYWYVCVTEAKKNGLFHVLNKLRDAFIERPPRRLAVHNNMLFGLKEVHASLAASTSLTRSLLFTGEYHQYPVEIPFSTMLLLKVLDALAIRFYEFPNEVVNLLLLGYLALTHNGELPSSISKLQRLRFLILRRPHNIKLLMQQSESTATYLPNEIWDLQELEYLRIMGSNLPDPSHEVELPKLLRLYVNADSCTKGVLRGAPSLERLRIEIELQPEGGFEKSLRCLEHTGIPHYLKSIKCVVVNPRLSPRVVGPIDHLSNLPRRLTKLSLKGLGYPWEYMSVIGKLPHLEALKLQCSAFRGQKWRIKDEEFRKLRYLLLEDIDVVHWTVEWVGFVDSLEHLAIRHCYKLKKIPRHGLSRRHMKRIEVDDCSPSLVESAQQIKDDPHMSQCEVVINSSWNL